MRFRILLPGKLRRGPSRALTEDYAKRCRRFGSSLELMFVKEHKEHKEYREYGERRGVLAEEALRQEADDLLARVPPRWATVAMDERGESLSSQQLAGRLRGWRDDATPGVAFLVGSPRGLGDEARRSADLVLSLSRLTLPHELAVVLLVEQVYRGLSILAGHPYHRE